MTDEKNINEKLVEVLLDFITEITVVDGEVETDEGGHYFNGGLEYMNEYLEDIWEPITDVFVELENWFMDQCVYTINQWGNGVDWTFKGDQKEYEAMKESARSEVKEIIRAHFKVEAENR